MNDVERMTCRELAAFCRDADEAPRGAAALDAAESHVAACDACRAAFSADVALRRALATPPVAPTPFVPRYREPRRPFLPRAAAAAVLLGVAWTFSRVANAPVDVASPSVAAESIEPHVVVRAATADPRPYIAQSFVVERLGSRSNVTSETARVVRPLVLQRR